jgi:predicted RNase H-like HicB family nuclease
MTQYPLLFGRRELVEGNGFVARVTVSGRALLVDENGDYWIEGINPGGFAANGRSPSEALAEFGSALRAVLFDIASDAGSFQDFHDEVQRFFEETNVPALRDWEEAVQRVKAGQLDADWLSKSPADTKLGVEVVEVNQPAAANNELGEAALAA